MEISQFIDKHHYIRYIFAQRVYVSSSIMRRCTRDDIIDVSTAFYFIQITVATESKDPSYPSSVQLSLPRVRIDDYQFLK